jgi:hypothetical protein
MDAIAVLLLFAALLCFILATLNVAVRVNLIALGLALVVVAVLAAGGVHVSIGSG